MNKLQICVDKVKVIPSLKSHVPNFCTNFPTQWEPLNDFLGMTSCKVLKGNDCSLADYSIIKFAGIYGGISNLFTLARIHYYIAHLSTFLSSHPSYQLFTIQSKHFWPSFNPNQGIWNEVKSVYGDRSLHVQIHRRSK